LVNSFNLGTIAPFDATSCLLAKCMASHCKSHRHACLGRRIFLFSCMISCLLFYFIVFGK
jgi:hypothetical protein